MIQVLLVERRSLFRDALAAVLSAEEDLEVSAAVAHLDQAVAAAKALRPDVIVVDIDMLADCPAILARRPCASPVPCAVLVLADTGSPGALRAALDTHVRGFVTKDTAPGRLAESIRRVHRGERVIDPALAVAALHAPPNPLSLREREVLRVAASGIPATEIAKRLHLSAGTVRNYVSATIHKTGSRNRIEAVRIATDRGWLT